jgi:DNA-directed RNA polymerase subunit M/transcription elongation factor TFIIS
MVATKLTPAAEREYVDHGGTSCPFCGSVQINESIEDGAGTLSTVLDCDACGEQWRAFYELLGIEGVESDEEDEESEGDEDEEEDETDE